MRILTYHGIRPTTLEKYLLQEYPLLSRGSCNKYLRENKIKLNQKKQPLSTELRPGDEVRLFVPDDLLLMPTADNAFQFAPPLTDVIFEDEDLLVVNKPAGVLVEDEAGTVRDTMQLRMQKYLFQKQEQPQVFLCHRLDAGTSGLLMAAKNVKTEKFILQLIKTHQIQKKYFCVTFGRPKPETAILFGYHIKDAKTGRVFIQQNPAKDAKEVETRYHTLATSGRLALLEVEIITGRTHQIRAHLASIGCPILGDSKYGNNAANRELKLKYQALCACELKFPQIQEGEYIKYSSMLLRATKPWYYSQILDGRLK